MNPLTAGLAVVVVVHGRPGGSLDPTLPFHARRRWPGLLPSHCTAYAELLGPVGDETAKLRTSKAWDVTGQAT